MSLNINYVTAPSLQEYFVDKDSGAPLAGGKVYFYSDVNTATPKNVYMLALNSGNYSYVALPNPVILSGVGTMQDNNGNDIIPYYYPFDAEGNQELYYIVVQSSLGVPQFTRNAWPNPTTGSEPASDSNLFNYIPNGQFLAHTDVPSIDHELVAGSNVIAQGGFSVELSNPLASINTLEFIPLPFVQIPSQSPRFECRFACLSPNPSDSIKNFRIKFNDVNKFSANNDVYTFGFYAVGNINIPISIQVYKFFGSGGSVVLPITIATDVILTGQQLYQYTINFGLNSGYTVDTIANNDFVAVDISFPTGIGFSVDMTDFILVLGQVDLISFPVQTNADMLARGVAGWMTVPDYTGNDLFLPLIATRSGLTFDRSEIGNIETTIKNITSPSSISPLPVSNDMLCDGSSYINENYSSIGIPFNRLGDVLIDNSPIAGIPMYGTGTNFATAYPYTGDTQQIRLVVNKNGAGIAAASDGNTGWTFIPMPDYQGSLTGAAAFGFTAYNNVANTVLSVGNFITPFSAATLGTTPFTVTENPIYTGITAQKYYSVTTLCTAASTLVGGTGNPGKYWLFSNSTTNFYMWFYFNGETDPAPVSGALSIRVELDSAYTAQDVANIVRETMNAFQSTAIHVTSIPLAGQHWLFSANPGASISYYVWYTVDNSGVNPSVPGAIGIRVALLGSDDIIAATTKTWMAIDAYKYAAPDFRGMFLRGADFSGIWDTDVAQRWSTISGLSGSNLGTFEYPQFQSHAHQETDRLIIARSGLPNQFSSGGDAGEQNGLLTYASGGSETRPVNAYVNYIIKY